MPPEDWRRAKVFAWMVDFAYFDRVAQIPLLILHARHDWPVHEMVEALMAADAERAPGHGGTGRRRCGRRQSRSRRAARSYFPIPEARRLLWPGDMRS